MCNDTATRTESRMGTQGIAVFDVCGTLTKTNNTSDFIGFVLRRDGSLRYGLFILLRILGVLCRFPGVRRCIRGTRLRDCEIALLRGYPVVRLREIAGLYVDALCANALWNQRIVEAMQQERERGQAIFLVSAAIDPPIAAIAERFEVKDFFSSELEAAGGVCTGRLRSDLLGRKHTILEQVATDVEGGDSSVYSDSPDDAAFMAHFARRYMVLNTTRAHSVWHVEPGRFHAFVNYEVPASRADIDSINERTVRWAYIPSLYYVLSRFRRKGLFSVLFREIIPVTLAGCLFTSLGVWSFALIPLSFLVFYSIYEIGGLVNDLHAEREPPDVGTRRISPGIRIHVGLFVSIRIAVVALLLAWLSPAPLTILVYAGLLCLCLAVYLLHTSLADHLRVFTVVLLKWCRSCIPPAILLSGAPFATLAWLCTVFFLMDGPWRVYLYCYGRGLIRGRIPVSYTRCVPVTILCGLGVVIYLVTGSPHLAVIGAYYVMLECVRGIIAIRSKNNLTCRNLVDVGQAGGADSTSSPDV